MKKITNDNGKNYYKCKECGLEYKEEKWAKKCELWCAEHGT